MRRGGIALGIGGGLLASALLAIPLLDAVGELGSERQTRADLAARIAAPQRSQQPIVASGLAVRAVDRAAAERATVTRIRGAAAASGVLVEMLEPAAPRAGLVTLRIRVSGQEKAVIALIDGIERGTPLIRFRHWRTHALADAGVRVEGELVGAWQ